MQDDKWTGLEDCIPLLQTGRYEVLTRTEDGERFIFPIAEPEYHRIFNLEREERPIEGLEDFGVRFPPHFKAGYHCWIPTDNFILHLRPSNLEGYDEEAYVGRFSYNPDSGEFLPATLRMAHSTTIRRHGTHPFNEYVRGIYVRPRGIILIRPYFNPLDEEGKFDHNRVYDPVVDREKTCRTIDMLARNGLPEDMTIITRANNDLIKNSCLHDLVSFI